MTAFARTRPVSVLALLLITFGFFGLVVVCVLLYGQSRFGLDYYCITQQLPVPTGSDPDAVPRGSFSWFPLGISCDYPQMERNEWIARPPSWNFTIAACISMAMALTGAFRLIRQQR